MRAGLLAAALAVVAVTACSQTAALAPVGGDRLTEVRFAALDVLVAQHIDVLVAPVCSASGRDDATISCVGTTVDQQTIRAVSTSDDQQDLEVLVAGKSIFRGALQDVVDAAARPSS